MGRMGNPRKSGVSDEQVLIAYGESKSVYRVERDLGIAASTIYRILERNGVPRVGLQKYREEAKKFGASINAEIRRLYEDGALYKDLMRQFGASEYAIKKAIVRAGGNLVAFAARWTAEEVAAILRMNSEGVSQLQISLALGRSQSFVSRVLRRNGVRAKIQQRESHSMWKGGRIMQGGYVRIKARHDDAIEMAMADSTGYALEHRVVASRKIGRPLTKAETVHHVNGDKTDNRPSNLEVHVGRHGRSVAMMCMDCGSRRVVCAPLKAEA